MLSLPAKPPFHCRTGCRHAFRSLAARSVFHAAAAPVAAPQPLVSPAVYGRAAGAPLLPLSDLSRQPASSLGSPLSLAPLLSASDSLPIALSLLLCPPGSAFAPSYAAQEGHSLSFLLLGSAVAAHGGGSTRLAAGDCLLREALEPLSLAAGPEGCTLVQLDLPATLRPTRLTPAGRPAPPLHAAVAAPPSVQPSSVPPERMLQADALNSLLASSLAALRLADRSRAHSTSAFESPGALRLSSLGCSDVFSFPHQENRISLLVDPYGCAGACLLPGLTFGLETFPAGHVTPRHAHVASHELFLVLSGEGASFCDAEAPVRLQPGCVVVYPPGSEHGIDVDERGGGMVCLELMLPDEGFADYVRAGTRHEALDL